MRKQKLMKMIAVMIAVMLMLSAMSAVAFADGTGSGITVYMTISVRGKIADTKDGDPMAWKEVQVKDLDGDGKYSYDEALKAAHSAYNTEAGYEIISLPEYDWVTSLWGVKDGAGIYMLQNGKATSSVTKAWVAQGDYLSAAVTQDAVLYADWACSFDKTKATVTTGKPLTLTLKGFTSMSMSQPVPVEGVSVGLLEKGTYTEKAKTKADGSFSLTFSKAGTYIVTAGGKAPSLIESSYDYPFAEIIKDSAGKMVWGKKGSGTSESMIGYTNASYGKGPYPYEKLSWMKESEFKTKYVDTGAPFDKGYLMYGGSVIYDCPVIAPCCIVTVKPPVTVKVKSITLSGISHKIAVGKKIKLTAKVLPKNATNKALKWKVNNKKWASVDQKGNVKLTKKAAGKVVIVTAVAKDGSGKKKTYRIKGMKGAVKKIKITGKKTVKAGKAIKLKAKVTAGKKANKALKWTSSNKKYATVTSKGKVKTKKAGKGKTVKIVAKATDGTNKKAKFKIKIQ